MKGCRSPPVDDSGTAPAVWKITLPELKLGKVWWKLAGFAPQVAGFGLTLMREEWEPGCKVLSAPGFCFFHLVLLFWNQIFTWVSVRLKDKARFSLSHTDRYRVERNLFSRATSCSYVKAVLARRGLAQAWSGRRRLCGEASRSVTAASPSSGSPGRQGSVSVGGESRRESSTTA